MQRDPLLATIIVFICLLFLALFYYGLKLDNRFEALEANIGELQRRVEESKRAIGDAKQDISFLEDQINVFTVNAPVLNEGQEVPPDVKFSRARDARRMSDMRQLVAAQGMYHAENGAYYTSATYPMGIGLNMVTTPTDPYGFSYGSIDNTGYDTAFCYYATLENPNTTAEGCTEKKPCLYYTASQGGNFFKTEEPATIDGKGDLDCAVQK